MTSNSQKILRIVAALAVLALAVVVVFGSRIFKSASAGAQSAQADHSAQKQATAAATSQDGRKILYWYDTMHPGYKSDKPGQAPDGMDLAPMYEGEGGIEGGMIKVTPERQRALGVRTTQVEEKVISRTLRTSGQVVQDETRIGHVHVKTPGWVESVFVDFVGQQVRKGQPLFTMYSPDLVATQEEYLIAKRGQQSLGDSPYKDVAHNSQSLLESARQRLELWDLTEAQIRKLDETGQVNKTITVYSPESGFIIDRKAFPHTSVAPDTELYTIADLSHVWVTADVYESELPYVKVGQLATVKLSYLPGKTFTGRLAYNYPTLDPQTHTAKVRIDVPNQGLTLKPNMFADVELQINYGKHMVVPAEAVLNSGTTQTVFVVHEDGKFEPREVTIGPTVDGQTIIDFGLEKGETIVTSGNFLLDSESRMKSALSGGKHQN